MAKLKYDILVCNIQQLFLVIGMLVIRQCLLRSQYSRALRTLIGEHIKEVLVFNMVQGIPFP